MTKKRKVNSAYEVEGPDDNSPDGDGPAPGLSPAAIAAATLAAAKAIGRVRANAAAAAAKAAITSGKASGSGRPAASTTVLGNGRSGVCNELVIIPNELVSVLFSRCDGGYRDGKCPSSVTSSNMPGTSSS